MKKFVMTATVVVAAEDIEGAMVEIAQGFRARRRGDENNEHFLPGTEINIELCDSEEGHSL